MGLLKLLRDPSDCIRLRPLNECDCTRPREMQNLSPNLSSAARAEAKGKGLEQAVTWTEHLFDKLHLRCKEARGKCSKCRVTLTPLPLPLGKERTSPRPLRFRKSKDSGYVSRSGSGDSSPVRDAKSVRLPTPIVSRRETCTLHAPYPRPPVLSAEQLFKCTARPPSRGPSDWQQCNLNAALMLIEDKNHFNQKKVETGLPARCYDCLEEGLGEKEAMWEVPGDKVRDERQLKWVKTKWRIFLDGWMNRDVSRH